MLPPASELASSATRCWRIGDGPARRGTPRRPSRRTRPGATVSKMEMVRTEGERHVARAVEFYNLDDDHRARSAPRSSRPLCARGRETGREDGREDGREIRASSRSLPEFHGKYSATSHPVAESWPDLAEYSPSPRAHAGHLPPASPRPNPGSSAPPRPGHGPKSRRPMDGLHLFTLAEPKPAGSHDFLALRVALAAW